MTTEQRQKNKEAAAKFFTMKNQEHEKLLKLENFKNSTLETLLKFRREHPYSTSKEEQYVNNPLMIEYRVKYNILDTNCRAVFEEYMAYREVIERKYKFFFPIDAEYVKDNFLNQKTPE